MGSVYSKAKIFHFKDKLDTLPASGTKTLAPLHIRIKPTNACAHSCWYCAYKKEDIQLGKDMDTKDRIPRLKMLEIINDVIGMEVKAVTFSGGGDPFYYPYLTDAVKLLADSTVKFASLTNGAKLSGELAELFSFRGTWVRISIDGWDADSYAEYRSVNKHEFTKVMKNIENFKKLGGTCCLGISLIVDNKNASHVYEFAKELKDIGVDSLKISPCLVSNEASKNYAYHQPIFEQVKSATQKAITELQDSSFEINDAYNVLQTKFNKSYTWCPFVQILPVIGADLNVYTCHDKAYNLAEGMVGSIRDRSFKEFWFNDREKFFKVNPVENCNHHCCVNETNKMIVDYLGVDKDHLEFVS